MRKFSRLAIFSLLFLLFCGVIASAWAFTPGPLIMLSSPPARPPAPSGIPAPAAAAGFTNHILAADFTSSAYANTATWIVNCGASGSISGSPSTWHWYNEFGYQANEQPPCSNTTITSDGAVPQVLKLSFLASQWPSTGDADYFFFPMPYGSAYNSGRWFPTEMYTKVVLRIPSTSWVDGAGHQTYTNLDHAVPPGGDIGGVWLDWTTQETDCGSSGPPCPSHGQINSWPGNNANTFHGVLYSFPGGDYTHYHTIESLTTSDENTDMWACYWLDANANYTTGFQGCINMYTSGFSVPNLTKNHVQFLFVALGIGNQAPSNDLVVYYKSIDVWVCAGSPASTCPGTMVTHWPFP